MQAVAVQVKQMMRVHHLMLVLVDLVAAVQVALVVQLVHPQLQTQVAGAAVAVMGQQVKAALAGLEL
jgi:hypothetical protein